MWLDSSFGGLHLLFIRRSPAFPWVLMFVSVLCYSLVPALMAGFGGLASPFLFNGVYRVGGFAGGTLALWFMRKSLPPLGQVFLLLLRESARLRILLVLVPYLSFSVFAWSSALADVAIASVLLEVWPVFFVLFMSRLPGVRERYVRVDPRCLIFLLGCSLGVGLVVVSGAGGSLSWDLRFWLGVALGLGAALMAAATAYNYRWAFSVSASLGMPHGGGVLPGLVLAFSLGSLLSSALNFLLWGVSGFHGLGAGSGVSLLAAAFLGGLVLDAGGTVLNRRANLSSASLMVNSVGYLTPVFALCWIFLLGFSGVSNLPLFLTGTFLVLVGAALAGRR